MMIDPGKLPLGRKSNNSSNREQEQGKRERGVPKNSTDTLTQQEKRVLLRFLFFFFSFFVGFLLCCTDGEEIAPFPFFQFFACLYAVTTCRNQKRAKSEKTKKQNQNPTETTLQRISFESNKKKTSGRVGRERMKPVEIGVGFFGGGGGEQLLVKKTTRTLQTGKGMVFFFFYMVYSVIAG